MFAVIKTGGKQYKVATGDTLRVEKLDASAGETILFDQVLMVGDTLGAPMVEDAGVQAEVIDQIKGEKVIHFVRRRRKHSSKRTKGHRQQLTLVRIGEVMASGAGKSGLRAAVGGSAMTGALAATAAPAPKAEAPKAAPKAKAKPAPAPEAEPEQLVAPEAVEDKLEELPAATLDGDKPENLMTQARGGQPDDLTRISGVGKVIEGKLHAIGVFHFDQIAAWGPAEIAYMDDQLSFKGRIERDDWIAQATAFAAETE
ncbi:MAG: 50S ribosomal protein L21 [Paracoccaceae bacterium]